VHAGRFYGSTLRHTFRPHGTKDWLLIYTRAGSGLYRFSGGEFRSRAHDVTLFRPGAFHDYQIAPSTGKWDLSFAHFLPRTEWISCLNWPEESPGLMRLSLTDPVLRRRVARSLDEMVRSQERLFARRVGFAQNALENVLLWCDTINPRQKDAQLDPRVRRAIDHLCARLAEPFSGQALARAAGLSPSRLRHLFRAQTGDSPRHFLESQRLRQAGELLSLSQQSIGEIAEALGFSNPFYFTLRFKKHTGESPRAYRQRTLGR
jgi:AraC family transcriptional regulator of arabinose operon